MFYSRLYCANETIARKRRGRKRWTEESAPSRDCGTEMRPRWHRIDALWSHAYTPEPPTADRRITHPSGRVRTRRCAACLDSSGKDGWLGDASASALHARPSPHRMGEPRPNGWHGWCDRSGRDDQAQEEGLGSDTGGVEAGPESQADTPDGSPAERRCNGRKKTGVRNEGPAGESGQRLNKGGMR